MKKIWVILIIAIIAIAAYIYFYNPEIIIPEEPDTVFLEVKVQTYNGVHVEGAIVVVNVSSVGISETQVTDVGGVTTFGFPESCRGQTYTIWARCYPYFFKETYTFYTDQDLNTKIVGMPCSI